MAAPPCPVWANTRGAAAIAVAAAPVVSMVRLIGSIIGALLDHCLGRCVRLEAWRTGPKPPWCVTFVTQVLLALEGRMPACGRNDPLGTSTSMKSLATPAGFEPATFSLEVTCSGLRGASCRFAA